MIFEWPTAEEERARALRRRIGKDLEPPRWRTHGITVSIVFFCLTTLALLATIGLGWLLGIKSTLPGAIAAIALGELLIWKGRFAGTGIESALWIGGLVAAVFALPGPPKAEGLLLLSAACAIAGARVRNPIFGFAAAGLPVAYVYDKWHNAAWPLALAIGIVASVALLRTWKRPSTEELFSILTILAPVGVYAARKVDEWHSDPKVLLLFAIYGCAAIALGLWARHRALLIAGAVAIVIARIEAHDWIDFTEWSLMADGVLLLLIGIVTTRALRAKTRGIVVTPASITPYDEAMQIIGTVAVAPGAAQKVETHDVGAGGTFGGAGSSGTF